MMLLKQARLTTGEIADVEIEDGVVAAIRTDGSPRSAASRNVHDLDGFLLLPAAADPHAHLDKTSTADVVFNPAGHLGGAIEAWQRHYASLTVADIAGRARRSALAGLLRGYTAIRTHVDVAEGLGLKSVEALLVVREELGKLIDIQVCGLVAVPMTGTAGAGNRAALRVALEMGIDVVGGAPWRDPDQVAALEFLLAEAASFARPIDLHLDETLDPSATLVRDFARLVQATGFAHGATASHCVSLGTQDIDVQQAVAAELAAGGISVIANPFTNLYLQARDRPVSPPRGLTALRELLVAGVNVAAGTDNVEDPFNLMGRSDPLEVASLLVLAAHLTPVEAYEAVSAGARHAMALPAVAVDIGSPADFLAVRADSIRHALATASLDRMVFRGEELVATTSSSEWIRGVNQSLDPR